MANENEKKFRVESDLLGELQVPAEAYYGVQTQRAINNYKISGKHMCDYPEYVKAIAYVKLAAAEAMLNNTDEWHRENNITNYRRRRDIAEQIMQVLDCKFDPNQVGMFLWGKIPEKYTEVEDLTEKILHEARVFITPGFIFGSNGKRYIRISLCAKDEKMKEALERIKKVFES